MQIQTGIYYAILIAVLGFTKFFGAIKFAGKMIREACPVILYLGAYFLAVTDISINERILKKKFAP